MMNLWKRPFAPLSLYPAAALMLAAIPISPAGAHGVVGQRFFPATITSDDPFAADELALPTVSWFDGETDVSLDYAKTILPGFAIELGLSHVNAHVRGEPVERGFDNVEIAPVVEIARDDAHEFILAGGLDWDVGGTGSRSVAERSSTFTPTVKFGKGFGDLPDSVSFLRPFAVTGTLGYAIPAGGDDPRSIEWAGAVEYSLLYLQNNVRDLGLGNFASHLTPIVEFNMSSPTSSGSGPTTGTINPGLIWSGQSIQLGAEAILPVNHASGHGVGFVTQLHFYIDDLFPHSLGKPLFGSRR